MVGISTWHICTEAFSLSMSLSQFILPCIFSNPTVYIVGALHIFSVWIWSSFQHSLKGSHCRSTLLWHHSFVPKETQSWWSGRSRFKNLPIQSRTFLHRGETLGHAHNAYIFQQRTTFIIMIMSVNYFILIKFVSGFFNMFPSVVKIPLPCLFFFISDVHPRYKS